MAAQIPIQGPPPPQLQVCSQDFQNLYLEAMNRLQMYDIRCRDQGFQMNQLANTVREYKMAYEFQVLQNQYLLQNLEEKHQALMMEQQQVAWLHARLSSSLRQTFDPGNGLIGNACVNEFRGPTGFAGGEINNNNKTSTTTTSQQFLVPNVDRVINDGLTDQQLPVQLEIPSTSGQTLAENDCEIDVVNSTPPPPECAFENQELAPNGSPDSTVTDTSIRELHVDSQNQDDSCPIIIDSHDSPGKTSSEESVACTEASKAALKMKFQYCPPIYRITGFGGELIKSGQTFGNSKKGVKTPNRKNGSITPKKKPSAPKNVSRAKKKEPSAPTKGFSISTTGFSTSKKEFAELKKGLNTLKKDFAVNKVLDTSKKEWVSSNTVFSTSMNEGFQASLNEECNTITEDLSAQRKHHSILTSSLDLALIAWKPFDFQAVNPNTPKGPATASGYAIVKVDMETNFHRRKSAQAHKTKYLNFVAKIQEEAVLDDGLKVFSVCYMKRTCTFLKNETTLCFVPDSAGEEYLCLQDDVVKYLPDPYKDRRGKIHFSSKDVQGFFSLLSCFQYNPSRYM